MKTFCAQRQADQWQALLEHYDQQTRSYANQVARQYKSDLAPHFYQQMLSDNDSSQYLTHDDVRTRLHGSMQKWIEKLFSTAENPASVIEAVDVQHHVGEVHARIGIPVHLVMRGARALKNKLGERLNERRFWTGKTSLCLKKRWAFPRRSCHAFRGVIKSYWLHRSELTTKLKAESPERGDQVTRHQS